MKKNYYIFACSFFFSLGGNILGLSLIYRLTDRFSFSPGQIGSFVAMGQLFYFLGCNLYHRFGSIVNPIKIFPVAAAVVFAASIPVGFAPSRAFVYAAYWIMQIATGLFWPPVMAWLTGELSQKELNRQISIFNRSWMAACIIGPLAAGALYRWNSTVNFFLLALSYFLVLVFLFLMKRNITASGVPPAASSVAQELSGNEKEENLPANSLVDKRLDLYRYRGWIGAFSSTLLLGILGNIVPIHLRDGLGFTERSAGMVLFIRSISGFIAFSVFARFSSWHFSRRWSMFLQGGLMLCAFLFIFAGSRLLLFSSIAIICGFMNSGAYNTSIFYCGATGKNPRKNMALHEIFLALGNATGSAGGGFIYQHFRFSGTCLALFLFLGLGMVLHILLNKNEDRSA